MKSDMSEEFPMPSAQDSCQQPLGDILPQPTWGNHRDITQMTRFQERTSKWAETLGSGNV